MEITDYKMMETTFSRAQTALGVAESHGALGGMLCVNRDFPVAEWMAEVMPEEDAGTRRLLEAIFTATRSQLADAGMGFTMLLPPDAAPLEERVTALGRWCQGYLYGLGIAGAEESMLPTDATGVIRDFAEIARITIDGTPDEEGEESYSELVEFVRMGVLLIREELRPRRMH